ncbi:unnamed protein product [Mytilus edulis]|uniref:Reverse transcriptase/retrotransposon-derived protein RNase H-like domain-containing protein n=1 Tax=Mytilus edulis TaxID=6550 RepID=A0A8S3R2U4_MYTED|nr:unnamed protein product [Mytilus edulis]
MITIWTQFKLTVLVGKCPTVSAYVAGFKVNCLVDTGSTVTTVTESFYNRFQRRCTDLQTDITFNLKGANGTCIPYIGYVEVDIGIMGQRLPNRGVLIVKDPIDSYTCIRKENVPGLLGMNVISLCKKLLQEDYGNQYSEQVTEIAENFKLRELLKLVTKMNIQDITIDLHRDLVKLQDLTQIGSKFTPHPRKLFGKEWTTDCQTAFDTLKEHLVTAPILSYAKFDEPFILETDASMQGLGAVLSQYIDGKLRVVAYASRALRPNERNMDNYSSRKLELLALTWAITEKFRDYLLGSKFTVFTDNNPLCYLQTSKLSAHEQRWLSKLAVFNFEVKYRQAKHNNNADALSRMHDKIELSKSEDVKNLLQTFAAGTVVPNDLASNIQSVSRKSVYTEEAFVTLPTLDRQEVKDLQERDTVVGKFIEIWNTKRKPLRSEQRKFDRPLVTLLRQWDRIEVVDGLVYRVIIDPNQGQLKQLILPAVLRDKVLKNCHDKLGHQGIERTFCSIRIRCLLAGNV